MLPSRLSSSGPHPSWPWTHPGMEMGSYFIPSDSSPCSHALTPPKWPHWHNNMVAPWMSQACEPAHHLLSAGEEAGMCSWSWKGRQNQPWWQLCRLNNFKVNCDHPKWAVWAGVSLQWLVPLSSGSVLCSVRWGLLLALQPADADWLCLLWEQHSAAPAILSALEPH